MPDSPAGAVQATISRPSPAVTESIVGAAGTLWARASPEASNSKSRAQTAPADKSFLGKRSTPVIGSIAQASLVSVRWDGPALSSHRVTASLHQLGLETSTPSRAASSLARFSEGNPGSVVMKKPLVMYPNSETRSSLMPLSAKKPLVWA